MAAPDVLKIRYRVGARPGGLGMWGIDFSDWKETTIPAEDVRFDPSNPEDERRACVTLIGSLLDSDESFGGDCIRDEEEKKTYVESQIAIIPKKADVKSYFDGLLADRPVKIERAWLGIPDHGKIDHEDVRTAVFEVAMRITDEKGRPVKREDLFSRPEKGPDKGSGSWERIK